MTTKMSKLALAIGALVMAGGAMAQSTATGVGTANATVIAPITITAGNTLEFGQVAAGSGLVTIGTDGSRTDAGGWTGASGGQRGTFRNATFAVTGQPSFTYSITLPADNTVSLLTTATGTITTMVMSSFTVAPGTNGTVAGTGTGAIGTLNSSGNGDLKVGAAITVNANQVAGNYTNSYSVIVAYN